MPVELQIAENVQNLLRSHGDVSLIYITANFEPFSSQGRPDIVVVPRIAPTTCFCVELRFGRGKPLHAASISALVEHREFVRSEVEFPGFAFGFATDEHLEPETAAALLDREVRTFSGVTGATDLADRILRWMELASR